MLETPEANNINSSLSQMFELLSGLLQPAIANRVVQAEVGGEGKLILCLCLSLAWTTVM